MISQCEIHTNPQITHGEKQMSYLCNQDWANQLSHGVVRVQNFMNHTSSLTRTDFLAMTRGSAAMA